MVRNRKHAIKNLILSSSKGAGGSIFGKQGTANAVRLYQNTSDWTAGMSQPIKFRRIFSAHKSFEVPHPYVESLLEVASVNMRGDKQQEGAGAKAR